MKSDQLEYYVEHPRPPGDLGDMEFFVQFTRPGAVATRAHIHEAVEFLYVVRGSYTVFLDGVTYDACAGDLILFCSNTIHRVVAGEEKENAYYVIKVPPTLLLHFAASGKGAGYVMRFVLNRPEYRSHWKKSDLMENDELLTALARLVSAYEDRSFGYALTMRLRAAELLLAVLRSDVAEDGVLTEDGSGEETLSRVYETMAYVQSHYAEDIDERALAAQMGVSYSYFSRSFRRVTGTSFRRYLNLTRIRFAEKMLLTSGKSVTDVASACGYNNVSYFIAVYKRLNGKTPLSTIKSGERGNRT